jgi:hypothetical protein
MSDARPPAPLQDQSRNPSLPATTTFQQDLVATGQRHINVMWERTQQIIAIMVSVSVTAVCSVVILRSGDDPLRTPAFMFLTNVGLLVLGIYFQRTNHTKTGGVGPNETTR